MPIGKYFKGHGSQVMDDMKDRYGEKKGKSVFYATANKRPAMQPETMQPEAPTKRKSLGQRFAAKD